MEGRSENLEQLKNLGHSRRRAFPQRPRGGSDGNQVSPSSAAVPNSPTTSSIGEPAAPYMLIAVGGLGDPSDRWRHVGARRHAFGRALKTQYRHPFDVGRVEGLKAVWAERFWDAKLERSERGRRSADGLDSPPSQVQALTEWQRSREDGVNQVEARIGEDA